MAMPMMAAQPVVYTVPQQPRAAEPAGYSDTSGRVDRLESAVKNLSRRMDEMEKILQEHTEAIRLLVKKEKEQ